MRNWFCAQIETEATAGFEPANKGFAGPCLTTWPRRQGVLGLSNCRGTTQGSQAGDGIRTRDLLLGKETFYH